MSRVVLVALHLAWCAVRGDDYSGGVMPQYGSLGNDYEAPRGDDYRGHSHDAPAPLDYKYEEEVHGDTEKPSKYVDEVERWRRPVRKQRQQRQDSEEHDRDLDSESEETPKSRLNRHQSRRKERVRAESSRRDGGRRGFRRGKHVDNEPDYSESNDYRGEANKYRDDEDHVRLKATTARVIRRKPRDRMYVPPAPADAKTLLPMDEEEAAGSPVRKEEWNDNIENAPFPVRNMAPGPGTDRRAPGNLDLDLESDDGAKPRMKSKYRNYQDYGDYYDMKRVSNIQNKLPSLLRRTTSESSRMSSSSSAGSAAERGLHALLQAEKRSASDAGTPPAPPPQSPPSLLLPPPARADLSRSSPTFPPGAVSAEHAAQWTHFIATSSSPSTTLSVYLTFINIIMIISFIRPF